MFHGLILLFIYVFIWFSFAYFIGLMIKLVITKGFKKSIPEKVLNFFFYTNIVIFFIMYFFAVIQNAINTFAGGESALTLFESSVYSVMAFNVFLLAIVWVPIITLKKMRIV